MVYIILYINILYIHIEYIAYYYYLLGIISYKNINTELSAARLFIH